MYDYVVADNAPKPHTKVVFREDIGDGVSETLVAIFFVTERSTLAQCTDLAVVLSTNLNDNL